MKTTAIVTGVGLFLALLVQGCTKEHEKPFELDLERLKSNRVAMSSGEERNAFSIPAYPGLTVALGNVPENAVFRLGILSGNLPVSASLVANGRQCAEFHAGESTEWADFSFRLAGLVPEGTPCRVQFTSESGFWVSHCELRSFVPASPSIYVFLIDTLRQDRLSCYGYKRPTTPNIDVFARDAVTCAGLMPSSSWTRPSVASLLTSCYPGVHGAVDYLSPIREETPRLASALEEAGFEGHMFSSNVNCLPEWGFGTAFFRFKDIDSRFWLSKGDDARVVDAVINTLDWTGGRPAFFYIHTMGPHKPYSPPDKVFNELFADKEYAGESEVVERERQSDLYDAEIRYTDEQFGRFVNALKQRQLYDSALIIVLADHGEEFWEHGGEDHGHTLYEEQLRIPLLIKLPRSERAGSEFTQLVEIVDVAPTILDVFNVPTEPAFQGKSFLQALRGGSWKKRVGYASLYIKGQKMTAAKTSRLKYIYDIRAGSEQWFDLKEDAREKQPFDEYPAGQGTQGEHLAALARRMAKVGAHGLHIFITSNSTKDLDISGRIESDQIGAYEMRYPETYWEIDTDNSRLSFSLRMPKLNSGQPVPPQWQKLAQAEWLVARKFEEGQGDQDYAHLVVQLSRESAFTLSIEVNGAPIDPASVFVGDDMRRIALGAGAIQPADIAAGPRCYCIEDLPRGFGAYIWYVLEPTQRDEKTIDPEILRTLEGLGYVG